MLQIDLFGKILGRSIAAINVCEPTDMGGIVVALSGNLMMEINFRRGGNERETEIDMIGCQKRRFIPALVRDNIFDCNLGTVKPTGYFSAQNKPLAKRHAFTDRTFKNHAVAIADPFAASRNRFCRGVGDPAVQTILTRASIPTVTGISAIFPASINSSAPAVVS